MTVALPPRAVVTCAHQRQRAAGGGVDEHRDVADEAELAAAGRVDDPVHAGDPDRRLRADRELGPGARGDRVPAAADEPRRPVGGRGGDQVAGREVRPHLRVARGRGRRPRAQRRLGGGEHGELPAVDGDLRPVDGEHGPDAAQLAQPGQVGRGHAARHRGDDVGHDQAGGGGPGEGGAATSGRRRRRFRPPGWRLRWRWRCAVAAAGSAPGRRRRAAGERGDEGGDGRADGHQPASHDGRPRSAVNGQQPHSEVNSTKPSRRRRR